MRMHFDHKFFRKTLAACWPCIDVHRGQWAREKRLHSLEPCGGKDEAVAGNCCSFHGQMHFQLSRVKPLPEKNKRN